MHLKPIFSLQGLCFCEGIWSRFTVQLSIHSSFGVSTIKVLICRRKEDKKIWVDSVPALWRTGGLSRDFRASRSSSRGEGEEGHAGSDYRPEAPRCQLLCGRTVVMRKGSSLWSFSTFGERSPSMPFLVRFDSIITGCSINKQWEAQAKQTADTRSLPVLPWLHCPNTFLT